MKIKSYFPAVVFVSSLLALSGQAQEKDVRENKTFDPTLLPPASTKGGVTFETDIKPLFEASCFRCHGAEKQKGHLRLDSLEATLAGGKEGKILTSGDSAHSQLIVSIARIDEESAMPPIRKPRKGLEEAKSPESVVASAPIPNRPPPARPLTLEEVGLVRAWIDQGAK